MTPGRLLGIDHGKVRLGLAISDPERRIASPLDTYTRRDGEQDARYFRKLIEEEEIVEVVIGLPVHTTGHEGPSAQGARKFGDWLTTVTGIPCVYHDERFSTVEAESALWEAGLTHKNRKSRRDRVAAQMILQAYLDAGCPSDVPPGDMDAR